MNIQNLSDEDKANIYVECIGGYTSISYLKRCHGYEAAKEKGDIKAAEKVLKMCLNDEKMRSIREKYADAILIPVIDRDNALPIAFADYIGLAVCMSVLCLKIVSRKNLSAMERILYKPHFYGYIEPNKAYLLVDDIMTQGGTLSSLIQFTIKSGGYVCAVIVLAYAKYSRKLMSKYKNLIVLKQRFGEEIVDLFKYFGISEGEIHYFTHPEMMYLMKFSNIENIKKKLRKIQLDR